MASLGEETRASCRGPSNHNAVALILPHKAMLGFDGGAIGADIYCDRSGIHLPHDRRLRQGARCAEGPGRAATTIRAIPYTTVPRSSVLSTPYASHAQTPGTPRRARGHAARHHPRVDVYPPGSKTEEPIVTAAAKEIKTVLGDRLGATLVESSDPLWKRDPDLEQMKTDFRAALARLVPVFMPDLLFRLGRDGTAGVQGVRRRDRADRVHARQGVRQRHDAADRLLRRAGRGPHRAAREPRSSPPSSSRSWRWRSASTSRNT